MKKILYILLFSVVAFSSCGKWLDVKPENQTNEKDMFSTGDGYRIALNGIYTKMSSTTLYGKEMTWGFMDVLAHTYNQARFQTSHVYHRAYDSKFTDKSVKSMVQSIWSESYNAVANCNKILKNIEGATSQLFVEGEMERQMILGEALGLRAFLQFDMLRMFAAAPVKNDTKTYIPYYDNDGSYGNTYLTVSATIEKIVRDLKAAKAALAQCDIIPENKAWMSTSLRILANGTTNELPDEVFFAYRAYRLNYYAVTATLARVYHYNGQYDLAAAEAKEIIDATYNDDADKCFTFTDYYDISTTPLRYDEVIFAIAHLELDKTYRDNTIGASSNPLVAVLPSFTNEGDDKRAELTMSSGVRKYYKQYYSTSSRTDDMIPMIRLSEMYYIIAEQMYRAGKTTEGIAMLQEVRKGAGLASDALPAITSLETFHNEITRDMKKSCSTEGQVFFQHKRIDKKIDDNTLFVFGLPDNEDLN